MPKSKCLCLDLLGAFSDHISASLFQLQAASSVASGVSPRLARPPILGPSAVRSLRPCLGRDLSRGRCISVPRRARRPRRARAASVLPRQERAARAPTVSTTFSIRCPLPAARCPLPVACCLLPIDRGLLTVARCPLTEKSFYYLKFKASHLNAQHNKL